MKRTKAINLERMKKRAAGRSEFSFKPFALVMAASTFVACSSSTKEAKVYKDANQCIDQNPGLAEQCEVAYKKALEESAASGPKYRTKQDCIAEFGERNCVPYVQGGNNWFMPAVAGFMFAKVLDGNRYQSSPLYTSYSRSSPAYGQWTTVDGSTHGRARYGSMRVNEKAFEPKPKVTRTISRGGFGSKVAAKSNWGGGSSRSSWGG